MECTLLRITIVPYKLIIINTGRPSRSKADKFYSSVGRVLA